MSELTEFQSLLTQIIKENIPITTLWAICKSVDSAKRQMTAVNRLDGLELFEVHCGYDGVYKLPKEGALCLLGMIQNQAANFFLIHADAYQEVGLSVNGSSLVINDQGYAIDAQNENLKEVLNDMIDELNKIIVIQGTTINVAAMSAIKQRLNKVLR